MELLALKILFVVGILGIGTYLKMKLDPNNAAFSCIDSSCDCNYIKFKAPCPWCGRYHD